VRRPETTALEALAKIRVERVHGMPHLAWAAGQTFRCPASLLPGRAGTPHAVPVTLDAEGPGPQWHDVDDLRSRAAFTPRPPMSTRLPISYQLVPSWVRSIYASLIGRWQRGRSDRWADFPGWPLDLSSDLLADWSQGHPSPWCGRPTPVVLSHDLDSLEGLTNLVRDFLDIEESCGARSTNFIVPCAWPIDHGLLAEVQRRGHEIGIHGYDHSNRTPFLPPEAQAQRVQAGAAVGASYRVRGYRAPSLLRTQGLLTQLARHYDYDSSIPTSGGPFPTPNNGCASARPYRLAGLVEVPLSLPRDGSLLFLGHRPNEIVDLWRACAEQIHRSGGVAVLLTHCERRFSGNPAMLTAYRAIVEDIASNSRFRWCTLAEVVDEAQQHLAGKVNGVVERSI
jgi:peptidoglycan/xylan/chitin deacetylase (PgdA/CDA1 family)